MRTLLFCLLPLSALAQSPGYTDTPMIPGTEWCVHDSRRPHPAVVDPGPAPEKPAPAPADAKILFDGTNLDAWIGKDGKTPWEIKDGAMVIAPKTGDLRTRESFGSCELHIEWASPEKVVGDGQGRGNSGIFLMDQYELQVLDSYNNVTYADGQAAALYGMMPPLVNACRPPGQWQTYDIKFEAPVFKDGKVEKPAFITVKHNGILVQDHSQYLGPSSHKKNPPYAPHADKLPIRLQDHGNPVRYRNIWIRPL